MFVILVTYKKPIEEIEKYLSDHLVFLDQGYQKNYFIVSGRKIPRTGGVILSQLTDRKELASFIDTDPFHIHDIADYEIIEFVASKYHPDFACFVS